MQPFFSIIVPTYNRAVYITDAIQSILEQSFYDFEIIIVDDGSLDDTEYVIRALTDQRIRYFKKKNEERSIARNFGVSKAIGRYINFLDSDDRFYSNHLVKAHHLLAQNAFPEVGHLGFELVRNGRIVSARREFDDQLPQRMLHENIMHGNAIFIRRDIALLYPFIDSADAFISEDWYVWMRLVSRFRIYYDNTVTSAIVDHEERSLKSIDTAKLIRCTELIVSGLKDDEVFIERFHGKTGRFFADQYTFVTLIMVLNKMDRKSIVRYFVKAVREDARVLIRRRFLASLKYFLFPGLVKKMY